MRLRFAPSPTGHLHVGNARTALFNWLLARGQGGTFVLRIEDTDAERSTAESERSILEDIRWLGLTWDEGPDIGGPFPPYRQSERLDTYRERADAMIAAGQAFYCFCTAETIEAQRQAALAEGRVPRYEGTCRSIPLETARARRAAGESAVIRFKIPDVEEVAFDDAVRGHVVFKREMLGDFVIVRSDGLPTYNFAVVVDDSLMEITHVIRGEDHVSNTPRQVLLYRAMGVTPPTFAHLSLVLGPDHTPLSKRHGATSVAEFRAKGILPESLVNYLALIGWSPGQDQELLPADELARRFKLEAVGKSAGVFDLEKLAWVNRHYVKEAASERLAELAVPFLRQAGVLTGDAPPSAGSVADGGDGRRRRHHASPEALAYLTSVMPMVKGAVDTLADIPARLHVLFAFDVSAGAARDRVMALAGEAGAGAVVAALRDELAAAPRIADREAFRAIVDRVKTKSGQKGKALFHPIRVALTGEDAGPELDLAVPAMDRGAELPATAGITPHPRRPRARRRGRHACWASRQPMIVYGINPVLEALKVGRVTSVWMAQGANPRLQQVADLARQKGVAVRSRDGQSLDRLAEGGVHQGVVAELRDDRAALGRRPGARRAATRRGTPLIVVLDGIEDPHNVGAILRTSDAAGVDGVIRQSRRAAPLGGVVAKASAGAVAHVKVADVVNIARAVEELKEAGVWTIGLAGDADKRYDEIDFTAAVRAGARRGGGRAAAAGAGTLRLAGLDPDARAGRQPERLRRRRRRPIRGGPSAWRSVTSGFDIVPDDIDRGFAVS